MKKIKFIISSLLPTTLLLLLILAGCSSRNEPPVMDLGSTLIYPLKKADGVSVEVNFFKKINNQNNKRTGKGIVFTIKEKANIYAEVDIKTRLSNKGENIMIHLDWIDPEGKSLFIKQFYLPANDTITSLISSISISPDKRNPGNHTLQVYYFRELIADKKFELRPEPIVTQQMIDDMNTKIIFYRKTSKKTGKHIGEGTVFTIKNKRKVRALIKLNKPIDFDDIEPEFYIEWIGTDGNSFYRKPITISPDDSDITLRSSISISTEKRQPGDYALRIYLFNQLIDEKNFKLIEE